MGRSALGSGKPPHLCGPVLNVRRAGRATGPSFSCQRSLAVQIRTKLAEVSARLAARWANFTCAAPPTPSASYDRSPVAALYTICAPPVVALAPTVKAAD